MGDNPKKCTEFKELCDALYDFFSDCKANMVEFYAVSTENNNFVVRPYNGRRG